MRSGPDQAYQNNQTQVLADVREYLSHHPNAACLEPDEIASRLGYTPAEITAALEALRVGGEILP